MSETFSPGVNVVGEFDFCLKKKKVEHASTFDVDALDLEPPPSFAGGKKTQPPLQLLLLRFSLFLFRSLALTPLSPAPPFRNPHLPHQ